MASFDFQTTDELRAVGYRVSSIRRAIERGELERVIRGWYATPRTDREAIRAMRLGGRLGCGSALRLHGAWAPPDPGMHIMLPSHASGRRMSTRGLPESATAHWHAPGDRTGSAFPVAPLELAVDQMLGCQPPHVAVAVLDSLLFRRRIARNRLEAIIAHGPTRARFLAEHLRPRSETGIESITAFLLDTAGIHCDIQVAVRNRYRVDLCIDDWLVIEVDGRATHADAFTRDTVRTAEIMRDGRILLRFAYATVIDDWPFVLQTIREVLAHHAPVR